MRVLQPNAQLFDRILYYRLFAQAAEVVTAPDLC